MLTVRKRGLRLKDWKAPLIRSSQERSFGSPVMSSSRIVVFSSMRRTASLTSATAARLRSPTRMVLPSQSPVSSAAEIHSAPVSRWTSTLPVTETNSATRGSQSAKAWLAPIQATMARIPREPR